MMRGIKDRGASAVEYGLMVAAISFSVAGLGMIFVECGKPNTKPSRTMLSGSA